MLYARAITLRNCGRFTVVASDFGSHYRTHTHVTSEALHASLTRGATWRPRVINLRDDPDTFTLAYDVAQMPVWFLPGVFLVEGGSHPSDAHLDTTNFNVVHEFYPSTGRSYAFRKGILVGRDRSYHVATYGTIEAVKPDGRLTTHGFSPRRELLEGFAEGQTFLLGKKRTMVQVIGLSEITGGVAEVGSCATPLLQVTPADIQLFRSYVVLTATMRYLLVCGEMREAVPYWRFSFGEASVCIPEWFVRLSPLWPAVHGVRTLRAEP